LSLTGTEDAQEASPIKQERAQGTFLGLSSTFLSFLAVGGMAFVVTEAMLFLAYDAPLFWFLPEKDTQFGIGPIEHPDVRLLIASVVAVETAIAFKFFAYEHWTFRDRPRHASMPVRFVQLNVASLLGTAVTLAVVNVLTPALGISPYISTPIGVLVAFMLNWVASSHLIWREHKPEAPARGAP
jgi:putative flippase GtrA